MSDLAAAAQSSVVFILKGYPRLSETFIAQEIHALEQRGLNIRIVSLRHPTDKRRHAVHGLIKAAVRYLPEYLYQEPLRVFLGWRFASRMPGYKDAKRVWLEDLKRDKSPNRIRRFGQACFCSPAERRWPTARPRPSWRISAKAPAISIGATQSLTCTGLAGSWRAMTTRLQEAPPRHRFDNFTDVRAF